MELLGEIVQELLGLLFGVVGSVEGNGAEFLGNCEGFQLGPFEVAVEVDLKLFDEIILHFRKIVPSACKAFIVP